MYSGGNADTEAKCTSRLGSWFAYTCRSMLDSFVAVPACTNAQIDTTVKGGNGGMNVCCASSAVPRDAGRTVVEAHKAVRIECAGQWARKGWVVSDAFLVVA